MFSVYQVAASDHAAGLSVGLRRGLACQRTGSVISEPWQLKLGITPKETERKIGFSGHRITINLWNKALILFILHIELGIENG